MSPTPQEYNVGIYPPSPVQVVQRLNINEEDWDGTVLRKRVVEPEATKGGKLEVLYDDYYYGLTDFIKRNPEGDIIKGLKKRLATNEETCLDPESKKRHDELTKDFLALTEELIAEGLMDPDPQSFTEGIFQSLVIFLCGLAISYWLGPTSLIWRVISVLLITLAGGQYLWLGHEGGHNAFTGNPKFNKVFQIFSYMWLCICIASIKLELNPC